MMNPGANSPSATNAESSDSIVSINASYLAMASGRSHSYRYREYVHQGGV
jgi:hypothetical protein